MDLGICFWESWAFDNSAKLISSVLATTFLNIVVVGVIIHTGHRRNHVFRREFISKLETSSVDDRLSAAGRHKYYSDLEQEN